MKKTIFTIIAILLTASTHAQVHNAVDEKIRNEYHEDYELVSIDTVAMPIRMVLSLNFAMTLDTQKAHERIDAILKVDPTFQEIALRKLIDDMENNLSELITPAAITSMRKSNAPHQDDYYNYQRTVVFLKESQCEVIFYIKLGENSISMTGDEYIRREAEAIQRYQSYCELLKDLKDILAQMK